MLNFNDMTLDFNNFISSNALLTAFFGNLLMAAVVIVLVVIVIDNITDSMTSKLLYSFMAVLGCLLVMTKLIKTQYVKSNTTSMDNQFSSWMTNNAASPVVIPKNKTGSYDEPAIDFSDTDMVNDIGDIDVDNFLYSN